MNFKRRVGNFLILFGLIGLLIFAASVLAPPAASFDILAFVAGAVLLVLGLNFRFSKSPAAASDAGLAGAAKSAGSAPGTLGGGSKPRGRKKK